MTTNPHAPDTRPDPLRAALAARAVAGDDAAGDGPARRDAFATLLYGLASGFAMREAPEAPHAAPDDALAERIDTTALALLRQAMGMGFREAGRTLEAIAEALIAEPPEPAVLGLVQAGVAAAGHWIDGERRAFDARILQATAGDTFVSGQPLLPR
jgi:hypothetical protein